MCTKTITDKNWLGTIKRQCTKPEYKNGLCKHHYDRSITKSLNWIDRPEYRPATEQDVHCGKSLKLRNTNQHQLFQCRKGFMYQYSSKQHKYILSQYNTDYNLFCVKYLP